MFRSPRRTPKPRLLLRLLALSALPLAATASCSAPSKGALVLAISTDMQAPKDINVVSVFITTDSAVKFDYIGRVLPDGTVALPSTLAIVEPDAPGAHVRIRITGFKEQTARVLRDVVTTVPHQQTSLLRLPLNFLDDGSGMGMLPAQLVPLGAGGAPEGDTTFNPDTIGSSCDFGKGLTSVNGVCASVNVDSAQLQAYDPTLVYGAGGLQPNGAPTTCFDVSNCFAGATPVVGLDLTTCTFPVPAGLSAGTPDAAAGDIVADGSTGLNGCTPMTCAALGVKCGTAGDGCGGIIDCGACTGAADGGAGPDGGLLGGNDPVKLAGPGLNIALVSARAGACNAQGQCFVPLDQDPSSGWTVSGTTVKLLPGVCTQVRNGAQLYVAPSSCPTKQPSNPVCQPTMGGADASVPSDDAPAQDATATFDASLGAGDGSSNSPDAGRVQCPSGWTSCGAGGGCVNTQTDPLNCGQCAHACTGQCQKGACTTALQDASASPGSCSPTTVSSGACFVPANITCTGLGTGSCSCTTTQVASCVGSGSGSCEFVWACSDTDAGSYGASCGYDTYGVDAAGAANGGGGAGSQCTTYCASAASAAAQMAAGTSGCNYFTGP